MDLAAVFGALSGSAVTLVSFLVALMFIVAVHELGHYWVGRLCGIHATTFSLGFGPSLIRRRDRHGTQWQISALPLGGYVKFLGDGDGASARADEATMEHLSADERRATLHGAPLWARMATVSAGPLANVVLTALILAVSLWISGLPLDQPVVGQVHAVPGQAAGLRPGDQILAIEGKSTPDWSSYLQVADDLPALSQVRYLVQRDGAETEVTDAHPMPPLVLEVQPKSAALEAGLKPGDLIVALDGTPVVSFNQMPSMVEAKAGAPLRLTVRRDGQDFEVELTPRRRDLPNAQGGFTTRWLVGVTGGSLIEPATRRPGLAEGTSLAVEATWGLIATNVSGIGHILTGAISSCNLSGPIGMAEVVGQAARTGIQAFLGMIAILSLGIGLTNLLPIPVLDGGHLVFHLWEAVTGRPPSRGAMQALMTLGLAVILALMLFALGNDLTCA